MSRNLHAGGADAVCLNLIRFYEILKPMSICLNGPQGPFQQITFLHMEILNPRFTVMDVLVLRFS